MPAFYIVHEKVVEHMLEHDLSLSCLDILVVELIHMWRGAVWSIWCG